MGPTEDTNPFPEARPARPRLPSGRWKLGRDPPYVRGGSLQAVPFPPQHCSTGGSILPPVVRHVREEFRLLVWVEAPSGYIRPGYDQGNPFQFGWVV